MDCPHLLEDSLNSTCSFRQPNGINVGYCKQEGGYRCIPDLWRKPLLLSHTGLQTFLSCHYLYYLKYILGIEMKPAFFSVPIKCGILFDNAIQFMLGKTDIDMNNTIDTYEIGEREVAKVRALYRALRALDAQFDMSGDMQASFFHKLHTGATGVLENDIVTVNGKYDRLYEDGFVETKVSTRPERYSDMFFLQSQVGTYFLVDPKLQWVTMEVNRLPDLKSTGQFKEEDAQTYEERCFQDIIGRPSHYFIGWNKSTRSYGKKYYRNEFDLQEIADRFKHIAREIMWSAYHANTGGFYKNDKVCNNIFPGIACDMLPICRHNTMNEAVYRIKTIPKAKHGKA